MDLNYLYHRHQVSQFKADKASCDTVRKAHQDLVDAYKGRISESKSRSRNVLQHG